MNFSTHIPGVVALGEVVEVVVGIGNHGISVRRQGTVLEVVEPAVVEHLHLVKDEIPYGLARGESPVHVDPPQGDKVPETFKKYLSATAWCVSACFYCFLVKSSPFLCWGQGQRRAAARERNSEPGYARGARIAFYGKHLNFD